MHDLKMLISDPTRLEALLKGTTEDERDDIAELVTSACSNADVFEGSRLLETVYLEERRQACLTFLAQNGLTPADMLENPDNDDQETEVTPDSSTASEQPPFRYIWRDARGHFSYWTGEHEVPGGLEALIKLGYKLDDFLIRGAMLPPAKGRG